MTASASLALASPAFAYQFGEPAVRAIGPPKTVFDWSNDACEQNDIPDNPARAYRDAAGNVQLIASHAVVRRDVGPDLLSVQHECPIVMNSHGSQDPAAYNDREWLSSVYTPDGQTIYGLSHQEYEGWNYDPGCAQWRGTFQQSKCWMNSVNLVTSADGGSSYTHAPAPAQLVAAAPYQYATGAGPLGVFDPSNVLFRPDDGYYYATVRVEAHAAQQGGICLMRTSDLSDPTSWSAWDGTGFGVRFINPYLEPDEPPAAHVCTVLSPGLLPYGNSTLVYSSYLQKYVFLAVSEKVDPTSGQTVGGFYYSLSDDLVHWSDQQLLMEGVLTWRHQCGDEDPVLYPSLLDPASPDRNFGTIGRHPYLYFTRFNYEYYDPDTCWMSLDRDLVRIPIEFNDGSDPPPNDPPIASFEASPNPALTDQTVTFDASASSDSDGSIASYRWDLDGDGTFETDMGQSSTLTRSFAAAATPTIGLQVTDDRGATAYFTRQLTVVGRSSSGSPHPPAGALTLIGASAPSAAEQPARNCSALRQRRARLVRALRVARHRLAATRGKEARRRLRVRIRSLERRLKALRKDLCKA
jgi:PKD repeat protein